MNVEKMVYSAQSHHILINAQSGSASAIQQQLIKAALKESKLKVESFYYLKAADFIDKILEFSKSDIPVLVGGGDGSISHAAGIYFNTKKPFGILPFGTMNMVARDLNIPTQLPDMFKAYENTKTILIDIGMINDQPFLCNSVLGVVPEASRLREETRDASDLIGIPRLAVTVFNEFDQAKHRKIKLMVDKKRKYIKAATIVISNNQYTFPDTWGVNKFKKKSLQDGTLGIYTASPLTLWAKIRLMIFLQFGSWKNIPSLREYEGQKAIIETERKKELVSVDGEPLEMETPLNFKVLPKSLRLVVPK